MIRGKMVVRSVEDFGTGTGKNIKMNCRYDESIPEDQRFFSATPSGHLEMYVDNSSRTGNNETRRSFYVDFTPV